MVDFERRVIELRRHFHKYPELSNREKKTSGKVASVLTSLGITVRKGIGGYGVVGLLEGTKPGKTVAIRADMDALPITEKNDVPYRSCHDGVMHACGHDAHMAAVLGSAILLKDRQSVLNGNVKFIFQPAEEKPPGGAIRMIEERVLNDPSVDAVFGIHGASDVNAGEIVILAGPMMAGSDNFTVSIMGSGGHGARPEQADDTILIASHFVVTLQNILNRKFSKEEQPVISIGKIEGGNSHNIIPKMVTLKGTVRYFSTDSEKIPGEVRSILNSLTSMFGGEFDLTYSKGYPVTFNNPELSELVRNTAAGIKEIVKVGESIERAYVSDDFGYYSQELPSCYMLFGSRSKDKGFVYPHHTDRFDLDDGFLPVVSRLLMESVLHYLQ